MPSRLTMRQKTFTRFSQLLGVGLFVAFILSVWPAIVQAEEIRCFDSDLTLTQDGTLDVNEEIVMDFQDASRHGIFRVIPVTYKRGSGTYSINLKLKSITDENGVALPYKAERNGPDLNFRIGNPDSTVTGVHAYRIHYLVTRALNFFDDAPELYWNVTGNDWPFPIAKCMAYFHPPASVSLKDLRSKSFIGERGSKYTGQVVQKDGSLVIVSKRLAPGAGMTVVIGLPKGSITPPSLIEQIFGFCEDWLGLVAIPLIAGLGLYAFWHSCGRDQKSIDTVSVEWTPPPDLTPAEAGTLIDERCDVPDVVSTLVDLASRGYLNIKPIPYNGILLLSKKDYRFTKTQPPKGSPPLKPHEILFLNALFGGKETVNYLSSLTGKFSLDIPDIKRAIWAELAAKRLFLRDPDTDRQGFYGLAILLSIIGFFVVITGDNATRAVGGGLIIAGVMTALAANAMPARTAAGSVAVARCRAFQRFVKTAEKRRIEVLAKDDPTIFGRLLPYAMVLGAADQWANAFKDLMVAPPDWYDNSAFGGQGTFSPYFFVDDLGYSLKAISSGFAAKAPVVSSSSDNWDSGAGGGFSGFDGGGSSDGGFGGGGGGSW
jgi:uncharacterized membrane protein YgcG